MANFNSNKPKLNTRIKTAVVHYGSSSLLDIDNSFAFTGKIRGVVEEDKPKANANV